MLRHVIPMRMLDSIMFLVVFADIQKRRKTSIFGLNGTAKNQIRYRQMDFILHKTINLELEYSFHSIQRGYI